MSCAASSAHFFVQAHLRTSRPCFAVSETGRHDVQSFLLEPVQECTEEQIMQVPVLQIIEICRNHMPVLYVAFRLRPPSKESVEVPNMQVVVGALFWNFVLTHWTPAAGYTNWAHAQGLVLAEISSSEIVALAQKPYLSGAESSHGPWSCRELGNLPACCQVPAERDKCAYGCICVAAVAAPRPLFITSWYLRATCRRFRPRREECLRSSFSLVLPLSFLIACLRPFSPASSTWPSSPQWLCFFCGHTVEHIVDVPAPQLQEDMFAGQARSTRTYFHSHCRANHEQIVENINQGYLPSAHAAMHSGADRVHAHSTIRGSNR